MKKISFILMMVIGMFVSNQTKAQSNADYIIGKWKITVMGTPNGDASMYFSFEKKDGKLTGTFSDSTETNKAPLTNVEVADKSVTAYFTTQGYDVNLIIDPVAGEADKIKGSLMGMFDAVGVRIKETVK